VIGTICDTIVIGILIHTHNRILSYLRTQHHLVHRLVLVERSSARWGTSLLVHRLVLVTNVLRPDGALRCWFYHSTFASSRMAIVRIISHRPPSRGHPRVQLAHCTISPDGASQRPPSRGTHVHSHPCCAISSDRAPKPPNSAAVHIAAERRYHFACLSFVRKPTQALEA